VKLSVREHVPLAPHTTLDIGGPARYFIRANSEKTVSEAVRLARDHGLPTLVLGGGSNLLISDTGFPGVVLHIEIVGLQWRDDGRQVHLDAGAGENWDDVVAEAVDRGLYGIECLSGIPGSVGGTPVQNVGAYGQEVANTVTSVRAYDRDTDRIIEMRRSECGFTYRSSIFNTTARGRYVILNVSYDLTKAGSVSIGYPDLKREFEARSAPTLTEVREAVRRIRARKAMLLQPGDPDCRSAGSFFKNPIVTEQQFDQIERMSDEKVPRYAAAPGYVKTAAAWLIERAGIGKGFSIGRAAVSSKHTLALVNHGTATAADMLALAREIRRRVEDRFGVRLVIEPVMVGFDDATMSEFM